MEKHKGNSEIKNPLKGKTEYGWHFEQQIYDSSGIIRAEKAGGGSGNIPKVIERVCLGGLQRHQVLRYDGGGQTPILTERRGNMEKMGQISNEGSQCGSVYSDDGNMAMITDGAHGYSNSHICTEYRIRKLMPLECWRLMDFSDEDFHKAEKVNSNTQLYKQAGNSIVVNVLVAILGQLFTGKEDAYKDCSVKRAEEKFF